MDVSPDISSQSATETTTKPFAFPKRRTGLSTLRILLFSLSVVSLLIGAEGATAHYLKLAWGNRAHPVGWLLSMLFLLLAFSPPPRQIAASVRSSIKPKTAFFVFWVLVFTVSHLWNFRTSPWNGDGLFDESGWDLWFLKEYVIGHPFQAAWFMTPISRETLFHYYVWGFLRLFGYNLLSFDAALFVIALVTFVFTLLLVHLFFRSYIVTSIAALIFIFLPYAFIYTFAGYRYPMGTALCVASLYFLHLGFKNTSSFHASLGGILAGLCLASSISGKQYLYVLSLFVPLYAAFHWKTLKPSLHARLLAIAVFAFLVAATPILFYIYFDWQPYTLYEKNFINSFLQAVWGKPPGLKWYTTELWNCFFSIPANRFFIPDTLPIPLPYYFFLVPGLALAVIKKRYDIALLATVPVVLAFIAGAGTHRLLLAVPFWIILMAFTFAGLLKLTMRTGFKFYLWGASALILMLGFVPSVRYIHAKVKDPLSIGYWAQDQVAVSRFLRTVVAGKEPANPPRLERDELKRVEGVPDAPYDTLICQNMAFSIIHLFLHDYGDQKILSFCGGSPMYVMTQQDVWHANKRAIVDYYIPSGKDLKLIWEKDSKTDRIIKTLEPVRELGTEESISFSFAGRTWNFYVLNIGSENIPEFQERVRNLPDAAAPAPKPTKTPTSKVAATQTASSGGWTFCANENEQCNFGGSKQVRYGANDIYIYGTFTDGVLCFSPAFGSDPISGVVKHCEYLDTSTPAPTPRLRRRSP
jgi:hypothetical protein